MNNEEKNISKAENEQNLDNENKVKPDIEEIAKSLNEEKSGSADAHDELKNEKQGFVLDGEESSYKSESMEKGSSNKIDVPELEKSDNLSVEIPVENSLFSEDEESTIDENKPEAEIFEKIIDDNMQFTKDETNLLEKNDLDIPAISNILNENESKQEEELSSIEDVPTPEISELETDKTDSESIETPPEESAENLPKTPVSVSKEKKKSKAPVLILAVVIVIAAGSYFMFLRKEKEVATVKIASVQIQEQIQKPVKPLSPFVYLTAQNVQKNISEGITTFVYDTSSGIESVRNFYKEKLSYLNYSLKIDDFKADGNYSHMVFAKGDKNVSVVLRGMNDRVIVVVSYVE